MKNNLTLGSLFDGSGGFPLGGLICGIVPLWASEIEPFPIRVTTKRLPHIKHYGDISTMSGAEVEPVDIITFGSPCQDMSVAGKRSGLGGSRSSLFYEAIRVIKEMRCATNEQYPRYCVWENVPGAFSSNKGEDFRCVLEALCKIKSETLSVPKCKKWLTAGSIVADGFSLAWRVLDAQYWGVPQRRKRIYLVADFTGNSAEKILFESEGLSRYSAESFRSWQRATSHSQSGIGAASRLCLNDQSGNRMDITEDVTCTLRAEARHPPCVIESAGFCTEYSSKARGIGFEEERSPTLRAGTVPATVYENHSQDTRYTGPLDTAPTVSSTYGAGGNNQPFVVEQAPYTLKVRCGCDGGGKGALIQEDKSATLSCSNDQTLFVPFGICSDGSNSMRSDNPRSGIYEADTSRTIDAKGSNPACNQGGIAIVCVDQGGGKSSCSISEEISPTLACTHGGEPAVCVQGSMIGREEKNGPQGSGINENVSFTLNATDRHAVAFAQEAYDRYTESGKCNALRASGGMYGGGSETLVYSTSKNSHHTEAEENLANTLVASDYKDPPTVSAEPCYIVRRLTPTECARLQGFPDWWCSDLGTAEPTDEDIKFWSKVFETQRQVTGCKPKTEKRIRTWLKEPHSDSAEYKLWGNGVALPCVCFVLAGIVHFSQRQGD